MGLTCQVLLSTVMALPPMAHTRHCQRYPQECVAKEGAVRPADLKGVNVRVNRSIRPEPETGEEKWVIGPRSGDCNDYAVTKRHHLLAQGWPSSSLLLAIVRTSWGEGHLILVADGLVLDNLTNDVRPWKQVPYNWLRVQSPTNPRHWCK